MSRINKLVLVIALLFLTTSCSASPEETSVSLSFLHLPQYAVAYTSHSHTWEAADLAGQRVSYPVYELRIGSKTYLCSYDLAVYDESRGVYLVMPDEARQILSSLREELHAVTFATPLAWQESAKLFPRMAVGDVLDLVTGLIFRVQRRGGTYHADVQPLTPTDTAVMKEIYGGSWSWDRRAVILTVDGTRIAASMNGMPHGQGALQNNFPGHFCIHFAGSTTHGSRDVDLGHMLMIAKASGDIWELSRQATPEQQARNFVTAFNQKDLWLTSLFTHPNSEKHLRDALNRIETINLSQVYLAGPANETCQVELQVEVVYTGGQRSRHTALATLTHLEDRWAVDAAFMSKLIQ